ncbi:hypothetical protein [Arthrobacter sp. HS15c]|uniref:hypothetical protein n=1 Tax=Arthrobacter sp. HS15c TaxID=3230279 RepID=UPI003467B6CA
MPDKLALAGNSVYETWVLTLRQWQKEPLTPLDRLPPIKEEDFSPGTWARLLAHIDAAITQVMNDWQASLSKAVGTARSDQDLGRELVQLRRILARRVQLARHSSLPDRVRNALSADAEASILTLQSDLETNVSKSAADGRVDPSAADRLLGVVRTNSLIHVLTLETVQDGSVAAPAPLQGPVTPQDAATAEAFPSIPQVSAATGNRRRVQFFDNSQKFKP